MNLAHEIFLHFSPRSCFPSKINAPIRHTQKFINAYNAQLYIIWDPITDVNELSALLRKF